MPFYHLWTFPCFFGPIRACCWGHVTDLQMRQWCYVHAQSVAPPSTLALIVSVSERGCGRPFHFRDRRFWPVKCSDWLMVMCMENDSQQGQVRRRCALSIFPNKMDCERCWLADKSIFGRRCQMEKADVFRMPIMTDIELKHFHREEFWLAAQPIRSHCRGHLMICKWGWFLKPHSCQ